MEYQDSELIDNISDNSEEVRDYLYDKYKYIVDIIVNKYKKSAYYLSLDMEELQQEALLGFSDALYSFNDSKEANLATFISICVERRVGNYIKRNSTHKMQMLREMVSLDTQVGDNLYLKDTIGDTTSPENIIEDAEEARELFKKIKDLLSPQEMEVYKLLLYNFTYDDIMSILKLTSQQVYDYVYRIRRKLKDLG